MQAKERHHLVAKARVVLHGVGIEDGEDAIEVVGFKAALEVGRTSRTTSSERSKALWRTARGASAQPEARLGQPDQKSGQRWRKQVASNEQSDSTFAPCASDRDARKCSRRVPESGRLVHNTVLHCCGTAVCNKARSGGEKRERGTANSAPDPWEHFKKPRRSWPGSDTTFGDTRVTGDVASIALEQSRLLGGAGTAASARRNWCRCPWLRLRCWRC